jgi:hypothetical protein
VAPNGDVYVAYHSQTGFSGGNPDGKSGQVFVARSVDGGGSFTRTATQPFTPGQADITWNRQAYFNNGKVVIASRTIPRARFLTEGSETPYVLVDPLLPQRIFVIAADDPNDGLPGQASDVVVATSNDFGATWTRRTLAAGPGNSFNFFPTAAIDKFGDIIVAWYTNGNNKLNPQGDYLLDVVAAYSTDSANTWSHGFQVNGPADSLDPFNGASTWDEAPLNPPTMRIGEYFGLGIFGDTAYVAWTGNTYDTDTRRPIGQQVLTTNIGIRGNLQFTDTVAANDNITLRNLPSNPNDFELLQGTTRLYVGQWSDMNSITIDTRLGTDVVDIENTARGVPVTVYTGGGANDTVYISRDAKLLTNIAGNVTVYGSNTDPSDKLIINDQSNTASGTTIAVTRNTVQEPKSSRVGGFATGLITYLSVFRGGVTVNGGASGNTFVVSSTHLFATTLNTGGGPDKVFVNETSGPLTVNGDGGLDTVNIGAGASYANIGGPLFVGNAGGYSAVIVDDSADKDPRTAIVYSKSVLGTFITVISGLTSGGDISLISRNLRSLDIRAGFGGNTFRIHDTPFSLTPGGLTTTVFTGAGTDHVTVDGTSGALDLNVQGGINNQTITIGSTNFSLDSIQGAINLHGPGGTNFVTIDDRLTTPGRQIVHAITATSYTRTGAAPIHLSDVFNFALWCGSADDLINVQDGLPQVSLNGGGGNNTLAGSDAGDDWNVSDLDSGSVGSVVFTRIQNLAGGIGPDIFAVAPAGQMASINGGGGGDWLDYNAFTTAVTADLARGTATGITKKVSNIQSVIGGTGNDTLTAGIGRNILIGGPGADVLTGGTDDGLLIGGTTSFESNHAALRSVLAEWQRPDADYGRRLTDLEYSGGLNGTSVLTWGTTVVAGTGDTLTGGAGRNWFFANLYTGNKDTITNLKPGEQVNNGDFGYAFSIGATATTVNGAVGNSINTDRAGNVYFGGYFSGTTNVDPGPGTRYFTTTDQTSGLVAKYSSGHALVWADAFVGTGGSDYNTIAGVVPDAAGNVFVDGFFAGTVRIGGFTLKSASQEGDSYVAKLNSSGTVQWVRQISGPSHVNLEYNTSLALDASGDSFVTGNFQGTMTIGGKSLTSAGSDDGFIAKLDPNGNVLFAKRFGGVGSDFGTGITITSAGAIFVTGGFSGQVAFGATKLTSAGGYDGFVAKLTSAGQFSWAKRLGGAANDAVDAVVVDAAGNVYASGVFTGSASFVVTTLPGAGGYDAFVTKLNSSGAFQWAVGITGPGDDETLDLSIDAAGNLYTAGWFQRTATFGGISLTSAGGYDSFVAKISNAGSVLWADDMGGPGDDVAYGVAVDGAGHVYSTGEYGYSSAGMSPLNADFDAGPATYNLTSQDAAGSAYISQLTQPDPATFTGLTRVASASYDLTLSSGDIQLVDTNRHDLGLADRISDLFTGSNAQGEAAKNVFGGTAVLPNSMNVHDDLAADVLTGDAACDWFFIDGSDHIIKKKPGDVVGNSSIARRQ